MKLSKLNICVTALSLVTSLTATELQENPPASYTVANPNASTQQAIQPGNILNKEQTINIENDAELKNAIDTIKILSKATRDAEVTENPNVVQKTPEELEEERQLRELNSFNKSLKAIKSYLEDTRKGIKLAITINNVGVAKIKTERFYVEKKQLDSVKQEIETNIKEYTKLSAQINLIDKTIESNNYAVTQSVFTAFSSLITQISSSVDLSGGNNMAMTYNQTSMQTNEVKEYYELSHGDKIGNNIFVKKINNDSIEIYYKA